MSVEIGGLGNAYQHPILKIQGTGASVTFDGNGRAIITINNGYKVITNFVDVGGSQVPVDIVYDIYIQSDTDATTGPGAPTNGSDETGDGTKAKPYLTIQGAIDGYCAHATQGASVIFHLGGYSVGSPNGTVSDPWDGKPDFARVYYTRELPLSGSGNFNVSFSYVATRKMFPSTLPLTFVNAVQVGRRVRLTFVEAAFAVGSIGTYIGIRRLDDDRDVYFPHVISEVGGGGTQVYVEGYTAADWNADFAANGAYIQGLVPAVQISGGPDYESTGVLISGNASGVLGDARTGGGPFTTNPTPHFAYVMIIRGAYIHSGQLYAATTWFDDGTDFLGPGSVRFAGCTAGPNGYVRIWGGSGRSLSADSNYLENLEKSGWVKTDSLLPNPDPVSQVGSPVDLVITGTANLVFGDSHGIDSGYLRIIRGLVVIATDRIPIKLYGNSRLFITHGGLNPPLVVVCGIANTPCIWAVDNAGVRTYEAVMELTNVSGGVLRVGKGIAISQADYINPAIWKGNFTRKLEATGGFPDDDNARIWDASWEPVDY